MIRGLPASLVFHAAVLGAGYIAWPFVSATRATQDELVVVPIELIDLGEITNIAAVREPDPELEDDDRQPEEVEEPPEDPVDELEPEDETLPEDEIATAQDAPPPEPDNPEDVVPDFDAEPDEKAEEPEPKEEPKDEPVARPRDTSLDDFLNSADSTFQSERQTRQKREEPKPPQRLLEDTPPKPSEQRRGAGDRNANTARLENLLYSQIRECWRDVKDLPDYKNLNVEVRILLDQDGMLREDVSLIKPSRMPVGRSPIRTAVERALTAVRSCEPYNLPPEDYDDWDDYHTIRLGPAYE